MFRNYRPDEDTLLDLGTHQTRVRHSNASAGETIIFLHSLGLDFRSSDPVSEFMPEFNLVCFDQRGHGVATSGSSESITMESLALDALEVLRNSGAEAAHWVGHSLGGAVAATALGLQPSAFKSLTILNSPPSGFPGFAERALEPAGGDINIVVESTLQRWFIPIDLQKRNEAVLYAEQCLQSMTTSSWASLWKALSAFEGYSAREWPELPYGVLSDHEDKSTPPEVMQEITNHLPGANHHETDNGGHMAPITLPQDVSAFVRTNIERKK